MSHANQFLISHGLPILFVTVLLEQLGLPIPAAPLLMGAGALAASGGFNLLAGLALAILACLLADALWFYLGRRRGNQVLGLLCRISLEPDSCVRRTLDVFTRYGMRGVVVAKFVPGMSTITPPLAGMTGINSRRFLLYDGLGSLLYCGCFLLLGYFFSNQITQLGAALGRLGGNALALLAVFVACYIAYKYWQRQRLLRELRMARITVAELRQKLDAGENPVILDLRSRDELVLDPAIIHGAIHLERDEVAARQHEFPRDRDIVVYCSCPNEITSARVALLLQRQGFTRVRPLLGGIDAWRENNLPMGAWTATPASKAGAIPAVPQPPPADTGPVEFDREATSTNAEKPL